MTRRMRDQHKARESIRIQALLSQDRREQGGAGCVCDTGERPCRRYCESGRGEDSFLSKAAFRLTMTTLRSGQLTRLTCSGCKQRSNQACVRERTHHFHISRHSACMCRVLLALSPKYGHSATHRGAWGKAAEPVFAEIRTSGVELVVRSRRVHAESRVDLRTTAAGALAELRARGRAHLSDWSI